MKAFRILAINPGSTSTKIALYEDDRILGSQSQRYDLETLKAFPNVLDQRAMRLEVIHQVLKERGRPLAEIDAFVGRGGLTAPLDGGTYVVDDVMTADLLSGRWGVHAANLGGLLARDLAEEAGGKKAFIVDPVVVDELLPEARLSGHPAIERRSVFHALNQKAIARRAAADMGTTYDATHLIVAHLGGGISVGAHELGRVVDVNNALDGEGPFSPERAGSLPAGGLVRLAYSGGLTLDELLRKVTGSGGLVAHLGTNDLREVERRIDEGDGKAALVFRAMAYQVARQIGAEAAVLSGRVDAIVLTGGLAHSDRFVEAIRNRVDFIAPVLVYPGEDELKALAEGALRVLRGEEEAKLYRPHGD
ncbi:butyrate kinase [Aminithiophilus ramosus]|uniref:Probable butyrate kinase n=1 Tax=Aminithiophilus ramosus TaxID=3029084 RepID=A0A9Q7APV4_9BACT|nr:butyrate kinase [Aminithiophilus ramosus]QTX32702.1 butyrate kinase [Aminithiophilus ramosus]